LGLRFILGRAGTGKTHTCLESMRSLLRENPDGGHLIFLVPEQATFQMEYDLAVTPGLGGLMRAHVVSFRRLAWRVLQEVGGAAREAIGDRGKQMVIRHLLENRKHELEILGRAAEQPGFVDRLACQLSELKAYRVIPARLDWARASLRPGAGHADLAKKLHDLSVLASDLNEYLAGRFTDPDDYLNLLAARLRQSSFVSGARVWVDGFAGFTPQEYDVLAGMLTVAAEVNVALCLGNSSSRDEIELFYSVAETRGRLEAVAAANGVVILPPVILDHGVPFRFAGRPALAHLEENFFARPGRAFTGTPDGIKLVAAANRRAEVEGAAREITRLCRDEGYRWREISVVLRDPEPYRELITTVFTDFRIPHFMDSKRPVMHHPLVDLIRSALEVVAGDWAYEAVFRYLKTDLVPVSRTDVDRLENYVLAHGIRGSKWYADTPWHYRRQYTLGENTGTASQESAALAAINRARFTAVRELLGFYRSIKGRRHPVVRDLCQAVFTLLNNLGVAGQLDEWSRRAEQGGCPETGEHTRVYSEVIELLDELVTALGDEQLELSAFARILASGLEIIRVGLVPSGLDQVLVGSLDRSRNPNVRAVFVLGVTDGALPARPSDNRLFHDRERQVLTQVGVELAPDGRRQLFDEQFLVYVALTRPSELLWLSYPRVDAEGSAMAPSTVITRIKTLFPCLGEIECALEPGADSQNPIDFLCHPGRAVSYLAAQLRQARAGAGIHPVWWDVYSFFLEDERSRFRCRQVVGALFYTNQETAIHTCHSQQLFGSPLRASVSRLEKFQSCPFSHFLYHGLRLRERELYRLEAPDLGQLFHAALKLFAERLIAEGLDWGEADPDTCRRIAAEVVSELAPQLQNEILLSSARYRHLTGKLRRTVERAVLVLAEHARRSRFRPVGLELGFGLGAELPPMRISLDNGSSMELSGRIDRVDLAHTASGRYVRVIDYKSGQEDLKLTDIYHGLKLQLLSYLEVALAYADALYPGKASPAGVLYFPVRDPVIPADGPLPGDEVETRVFKALKMKGLILADVEVVKMMDSSLEGSSNLIPVGLTKAGGFHRYSSVATAEQFELLREHLHRTLAGLGGRINAGEVEIRPSRKGGQGACQYCGFHSVCRFDLLIDGNDYRILRSLPAAEVWSRLSGSGGEGRRDD